MRVVLAALSIAVLAAGAPGSAIAQSASPAASVAKAKPRPTIPADAKGKRILTAANAHRGLKILVSTEDRWFWLINGRDTLMSIPVGIGMGKSFEFEGKKFFFETPRSQRRVIGKQENPKWNVPEWHYMERAQARSLELVRMTKEAKYPLDDGSFLLTIGDSVGRLNHYGNFYAFPPGDEVIYDGKVFMPPMGTAQRMVPDALGPFKLDTGDGYLLHGTNMYNEDTIGGMVSHGCVRLSNENLELVYKQVPVGTPVFIF